MKPIRNIILACVIFVGLIWGFVATVNHPKTLEELIPVINKYLGTNLSIEKIKWSPLLNNLEVNNFSLETKGIKIKVQKIDFNYSLFGVFSGRIVARKLALTNPYVEVIPIEKMENTAKKGLSAFEIYLLKHIVIDDGSLNDLRIKTKENEINAKKIALRYEQEFLGNPLLSIDTNELSLMKDENEVAFLSSASLTTSAGIEDWWMKGSLKIEMARMSDIELEKAEAKVNFSDQVFSVEKASLKLKNGEIEAKAFLNKKTGEIEAEITTPQPISVPFLVKPIYTIETGGKFKGSAKIRGTIAKEIGKVILDGDIDIEHEFEKNPSQPVRLSVSFKGSPGSMIIEGAKLKCGEDEATIDGEVNFAKKMTDLRASSERFPAEAAFRNFRDPNLARIFGNTELRATFKGWAKDFEVQLQGTTSDGGWFPLKAKTATTDLSVTYKQLKAKWEIIQNGRASAKADLAVNYGRVLPDSFREKNIGLTVEVNDYDAGEALESFDFKGKTDGNLTLTGTSKNLSGKALVKTTFGKYQNIPFDKIETGIDIKTKKLIFENTILTLPDQKGERKIEPITLDIKEGEFRLYGSPVEGLEFSALHRSIPNSWKIDKISYRSPNENIELRGSYFPQEKVDLSISGNIDLASISPFIDLLERGEGPLDIKVSLTGNPQNPNLNGKVDFNGAVITPRGTPYTLEELSGSILLSNKSIAFKDTHGRMEEGDFNLNGTIAHNFKKIERIDLKIEGKNVQYYDAMGRFRVELSANVVLKGNLPSPTLSGSATITDGKYMEDFSPLGASKKEKQISELFGEKSMLTFDPNLDLSILCRSDFSIQNNLGEIWLNADVRAKGKKSSPKIEGTISTNDGFISYLGLNFDIKKGLMELRERSKSPYLEVEATREIKNYNVTLLLHGELDNLAFDLFANSATGSLERDDVISLIAFGATSEEMRTQAKSTSQFGTSVLTQQLTGFIEKPVTKLTHLDVFRLEASDPSGKNFSRLYFGKQLSDRISLNFSTDINTERAVQTVTAEYQLIDNLLLKGSQSSDERYGGTLTLRFRLR